MGMLWGGYTLLFWGFCRIKGYDLGLGEIVIPGKWNGKWPPKLIDDGSKADDPKVKPGDHPGDMPWTYPKDPNEKSAGDKTGGGKSDDGDGGVFNA